MSMPVAPPIAFLPAELVAQIVAEIASAEEPTSDLKRCALVARSWAYAAQAALFRALAPTVSAFAPLGIARLAYLAAHPHLGALVRELSWTGWDDPALAYGVAPDELAWVANALPGVATLRLVSLAVDEDMRVPPFCLRFPALERVRLFYPSPLRWDMRVADWARARIRVLDVFARGDLARLLFGALVQTGSARTLERVKVYPTSLEMLALVSGALTSFNALCELELDLEWVTTHAWDGAGDIVAQFEADIALTSIPSLQTLSIHTPTHIHAFSMVRALLCDAHLPAVRHFVLHLCSLERQAASTQMEPPASSTQQDALISPAIASALASCLVVFKAGVAPWHTDVLCALLSLAHRPEIVRVEIELEDTSDVGSE